MKAPIFERKIIAAACNEGRNQGEKQSSIGVPQEEPIKLIIIDEHKKLHD